MAAIRTLQERPIGALVLSLALAAAAPAPGAAATGGWTFSWSDEFDGTEVDASIWGFENGYVRNNEAQYYSNRAENSRIEDGKLLIRALRDNWNGREYTSASRTTRGKKSFRYGRFELRAKIDVRSGSWPAWWWLPNTGGWPKGGEIDMMEFYQGKCLFNVMDGDQRWTAPTRTITSLGGARWAEEYHTWTMVWDSTKIQLSLDGVLINDYPLSRADGTGPGGNNPFRQPGYMIVNQALGGTNGGDHTRTQYPIDYRIDWIRVHTWDPSAPSAQVTVLEGTGSGAYAVGTRATLTAKMPPVGQAFSRWEVVSGNAVLDNPASPTAVLTVGSADVSVRATYGQPNSSILLLPNGRLAKEALPTDPLADLLGRRLSPASLYGTSIKVRAGRP